MQAGVSSIEYKVVNRCFSLAMATWVVEYESTWGKDRCVAQSKKEMGVEGENDPEVELVVFFGMHRNIRKDAKRSEGEQLM